MDTHLLLAQVTLHQSGHAAEDISRLLDREKEQIVPEYLKSGTSPKGYEQL